MTFHDRRMSAARKVGNLRNLHLLKQGTWTINLWNTMPTIALGTVADDWKAVGGDIRYALTQFTDEHG